MRSMAVLTSADGMGKVGTTQRTCKMNSRCWLWCVVLVLALVFGFGVHPVLLRERYYIKLCNVLSGLAEVAG